MIMGRMGEKLTTAMKKRSGQNEGKTTEKCHV